MPVNLYFIQLKEAAGPDMFCSPSFYSEPALFFNKPKDIPLSKLPLKHLQVHKNVLRRVSPFIRPN